MCHLNNNMENYYRLHRQQMREMQDTRMEMMTRLLTLTNEDHSMARSVSCTHAGFYLPPQNFGSYMNQTYMQPVQVAGGYPVPPQMAMSHSFYPFVQPSPMAMQQTAASS